MSQEQATPERWTYTGPPLGLVSPRNLRGTNGRVKVTTNTIGPRLITMDEFSLEVPQGLAWELSSALGTALRPYAGFSIFQHIMTEMDDAIDLLMAERENQHEDEWATNPEILRLQGECHAYAVALSMVRKGNPTDEDIGEEKAQAMTRWEHNNL